MMSALSWGDFCGAMLAGVCLIVTILTAEKMRAPSPQAEQKSLALLRLWLSPEQAAQYISNEHFDVIGSDTGTRYRIRHGCMINIDQLDRAGNKVCAWCFVPEGILAAGDCMLAQKIALETFETKVLAIANRSEGNVWRRPTSAELAMGRIGGCAPPLVSAPAIEAAHHAREGCALTEIEL
jgi:hypothetical protein